MANAFTPVISGSFAGELVWNLTTYVVADTFSKYVDSMEFVHRPKAILKRTGFETFKHLTHKHSGNSVLIDIAIILVGDLPRWLMQQLKRLAIGVNGAGMQLNFREDWWTDYTYSCRWINAGDFTENSHLLCGGTMMLESWAWSAI